MQRSDIGRLGVWAALDSMPAPRAAEFCQQLEAWGYCALWMPEAVGRDPFPTIGYLAAHAKKLIFATGIANIYARDPMTMRATQQALAELTGDRLLLGLGVSHAPMVEGMRKHHYGKPIAAMSNYLDAMKSALYLGAKPAAEAPIVLAALRPKMLALAAEKTQGAHPYNVTPEHTKRAREILGAKAWLCPEQMVLLETNPSKAREIARKNLATYLVLPNYRNNLKWIGFSDADLDQGGSDRLVDGLVAWGDEKAIEKRIREHHDAGADHVCIQSFRHDGSVGADERVLAAFAPRR
jgi:probable F420-dependent oxidoreductase